jgi:hypothetical protein
MTLRWAFESDKVAGTVNEEISVDGKTLVPVAVAKLVKAKPAPKKRVTGGMANEDAQENHNSIFEEKPVKSIGL